MSTKRPKDRSGLCAFAFADGRQCRTPRRSGHPHLCYFHAQKEAESLAAKQAGKDISTFFFANLLTACDLSAAMARLFSAVACGDVKPKVASTLAYLSQTMIQSIPIAQHEFCEAFSSDSWRKAVRSSFHVPVPPPKPAPQAAPPAPSPTASQPPSQPNPKPSSQPAPPQPKPQQVTQPTSRPAPQPAPQSAPQPAPPPAQQPAPPQSHQLQSSQPQSPQPLSTFQEGARYIHARPPLRGGPS